MQIHSNCYFLFYITMGYRKDFYAENIKRSWLGTTVSHKQYWHRKQTTHNHMLCGKHFLQID